MKTVTIKDADGRLAYSIRAAEQSVCGESIFVTDPHGKIAQGYMAAAREVIAHG